MIKLHLKLLKALGLPLLLMAALQATPAWADMWRFVDAHGVSHFSSTQLDKRYVLLFRGAESLSAGARNESAAVTEGSAAASRRQTRCEGSPKYLAVKHLLLEASDTHGIDYALLQAVIATESGFDTRAVSPKGAVGLMQLIPPTAERYGVKAEKDLPLQTKLTDPRVNIAAGSRYLRDLIKMFPGQLELAVAAYNAGEGAVQRAGNKIPNYPETQNYVKNGMQLYSRLKLPAAVSTASRESSGRVRMEFTRPMPSGVAPGVTVE